MRIKRIARMGLIGILLACLCFSGLNVEAASEETFDGSFTIYKRVKESEILRNPQGFYRFRLEWLDENGQVEKIKNEKITLEEGRLYPVDCLGYAILAVTFDGLEEGTYRIAELGTEQYSFEKGGNYFGQVWTDNNAVIFSLDERNPRASATFVSRLHDIGAGLSVHL